MSAGRLKVLLLVDIATFHGQRIASQLRRQGVRVLAASLERGQGRYLKIKRVGPIKSLHYVLAIPRVRKIIKRFKPDVVYAHYASGYGFIAAGAVSKGGQPVLLNLWGSEILHVPDKSIFHRFKTRLALKKADYVLADSQYLLECAGRLRQLDKKSVIYWGIETEYLGFHKKSYEIQQPLKLIVPRAHEPVYHNEFILEALAPLVSDGNVELTFPGFGSMTDRFKRRAGELTDNKVKLYPKMPRGEFMKFMSGHDVYLSAARTDSSPVSLIEAMGLGLIPVCADIDGVKEWLTDQSGFVFQQNDGHGLRELIARIAREDKSYEDLRRANLGRVRQEAIFESNVAEQIDIMKRLAGRG